MTLKDLINSIPAESKYKARLLIAESVGLKEPSVRSMANGNRKITAENARAFEKAFPGKITASDLRPDIFTN